MEGMLAMLDYREDDVTPFMLFFKDGLLAEKCVSKPDSAETQKV